MNQERKTITSYIMPAAIIAALALVGVQIIQAENESNFVTGDIIAPVKCHGHGLVANGAEFIEVMQMTPEGVVCGCHKKC